MPTGNAGAAFMRNLPSTGYIPDNAAFDQLTERNEVPLDPIAFTGLGGAATNVRIPNNGVLASIRFLGKFSLVTTTATGTVTSNFGWPWNIVRKFTLNANGQTSLKQASGLDLRMRRQKFYRNPSEEVMSCVNTDTVGAVSQIGAKGNPRTGTIAAGTYAVTIEWLLPITHNDAQMIGALFAQTDQNYLSFALEPAASGDLFTITGTSTATLTGTIYPLVTFYDVPIAPTNPGANNAGAAAVIIPDLSFLHGILSSDFPFANTGRVRAPLIRTDGELLAYGFYIANGPAAQIALSALSEVRLEYGGNRIPRVYKPVEHFTAKMQADYNGLVQPNWGIFDFEVDNDERDRIIPKGVAELAVSVDIPSGTTINANALIHFVEETLFTGA